MKALNIYRRIFESLRVLCAIDKGSSEEAEKLRDELDPLWKELGSNISFQWSTEFPKIEGDYWFYGYRYGKVSCGTENNPEWMHLRVRKCANGFMYIAAGQFMYETEVEDPHFIPILFPDTPNLTITK